MGRQNRDYPSRIADICQDDSEVLALSLLRYVAAGYMTSDIACWDAAYDAAEQRLGAVEGAQLVAAMTGIVRSIRLCRNGCWHFMPATCCRATADEEGLIRLISQARRGSHTEIQRKAEDLMGAGAPSCVCAAVSAAAERLNAAQHRLGHGASQTAGAVMH